MMNRAKFMTSLNEVESLLRKLGLLKSKGPKGNGVISEGFLKISKSNNLLEIYKYAIEFKDYDFLLKDDSLFQFQITGNDLRYAFIQNPYKFFTKEEYLQELYLPDELNELYEHFSLEEIIKEDEYEQFLNEQILNSISNYFRYDCSPAGYSPLVHSYSHIHIGPNENIRIPTGIYLTPRKFAKFCIRNTYFELWKNFCESDENFFEDIKTFKNDCMTLPPDLWNDSEKNELYLS